MTSRPLAVALALLASAALAQTTPGGQFLQNWDLDGDGTATPGEIREMRGNVFLAFDANQDGALDAEEYELFDEARANDVANYDSDQRAQMQAIADGLGLAANDANGDGGVSREEFLAGADDWFGELDTDGSGGVTLEDF